MVNYKRNSDPNYYKDYSFKANCGSYAFNLQGWYDPEAYIEKKFDCEIYDFISDLCYEGYTEEDAADIYAEELVEGMINEFDKELREIYYVDETIEQNEELVAFRTFTHFGVEDDVYFDFHFQVFRNGKWMEKCGREPVKECDEENRWGRYSSKIYYFAHKVGGYNEG